jgi:6-phosphogluconolactonase
VSKTPTSPLPDPTPSSNRIRRRTIFPLIGAAAVAAALAPAATLASVEGASVAATELLATQAGNLVGNPGGSFANYQISNPSAAVTTLNLFYSPSDSSFSAGIGFNVYQSGTKLASVTGASLPLTATFTPSASGGPVLVQVFNYSTQTINYSLSSSLAPVVLPPGTAHARFVYVGTYTSPNSAQGIYVFKMDPGSGSLTWIQTVPTENPSFLAIDPQQKYLYSTNENGMLNGKPNGAISAWAIDPAKGTLSPLNQQLTNGTYPAHISVHPSGKYLLGSNYGTGTFPIYPILGDGRLGPMSDVAQDQGVGTGTNPGRQEGPHAHMILTDPTGSHVVGVDLGADKMMVWTLNLATGKLSPNTVPYGQVASGSGSRHAAFHPTSKFAYVISEMGSSITAYSYDSSRGAFTWTQTVSTLPPDFSGNSSTAEIRVHPSGRFVYGTNRGHDSVVAFSIDQNTGKLTLVGWQPTLGKTPRGMNIDPSGTFLYAGNQGSNTIGVFRVNLATGQLVPTGQLVQTLVPVDIEFGGVTGA